MVTKNSDKAPATDASQATATAFAAPTKASGPAANVPAGDAAAKLLEQPAPQGMTSSAERAADDTEQQTAAMARAAQDQAAEGARAEAEKGEAAAAEISAIVPSAQPIPGDTSIVEAPAAAPSAPGPALDLAPEAAADPASDPIPAVTGAGGAVQTKSGRMFTGQLAALWTKLKEGATHAEMRAASGIHDVESHLRRWEAEGVARITSKSAPGGIVWQAKEQGEP